MKWERSSTLYPMPSRTLVKLLAQARDWYHAEGWQFELLPLPPSRYGRDELIIHMPGGTLCGYSSWDRRPHGCSGCGLTIPPEIDIQFQLLRKGD